MAIKARPFKTTIGKVEVGGFFEDQGFVFKFYGLVTFRLPIKSAGHDEFGEFAILEETEISQPDGFVFMLETNYDPELRSEWGYVVTIRRDEINDRVFLENILRDKGVNPESARLIIPPRQLTAVYFNPRGEVDGSSQQLEENSSGITPINDAEMRNRVLASARRRILFLPHAVRQMSRPDRMITTGEVRDVVEQGILIETYLDDPRGPSCLLMGEKTAGRAIHVVCSPKSGFLAIITAYLPDRTEWTDDFRSRIKR